MWSAAGRKRRWNAVRRPISGPISAAVDMPWPIVLPGGRRASRCAAAGFWAWISRGWTCCSAETAPFVCEVNSNAFMAAVSACSGVDVAARIVDHVFSMERGGRPEPLPSAADTPGNETPGRPPRGGTAPSASSRGLRTAALISPGPGICLSFHTSNAPKAPRGRKTWMAINPKCARWGPDDMDKAVKK